MAGLPAYAPMPLRVLFGTPDGPIRPSPEIDLSLGHFYREYVTVGDFNGDGTRDLAAYEGPGLGDNFIGSNAFTMSFAGPGHTMTPVGWLSVCSATIGGQP